MPIINSNSYMSTIECIQETIDNYDKTYELQIFSIQECWVWRAGIFYKITKEFMNITPNWLLCILHIISIIITSLFIGGNYNPLEYVKFKENLYIYQDNTIKMGKLMNSGLAIITNQEADDYGFEYFKCNKGLEKMASKGFQYIYYDNINTIIINIHLQSGQKMIIKENQLKQIKKFINNYKQCNIFIIGDYNIDINETGNDNIKSILGLIKINDTEITTIENKSYDHCYTNVELDLENSNYEIYEDKKSDHYKLTININKDLRLV